MPLLVSARQEPITDHSHVSPKGGDATRRLLLNAAAGVEFRTHINMSGSDHVHDI